MAIFIYPDKRINEAETENILKYFEIASIKICYNISRLHFLKF